MSHLSAEQSNALPEGLQDVIKGLDAVWCSCFSKCRDGQRCDGLHLLVLVHQPMLHNVHQRLHIPQITLIALSGAWHSIVRISQWSLQPMHSASRLLAAMQCADAACNVTSRRMEIINAEGCASNAFMLCVHTLWALACFRRWRSGLLHGPGLERDRTSWSWAWKGAGGGGGGGGGGRNTT